MKILFFTDLHATIKHGLFGMSFLDQIKGTFEFVADRANAENVDAVFFLGDVFHFQKSVDTPSIHAVKSGFRHLVTTSDAPVYAIPGNHDMFKKGGLWTSVEVISDVFPNDKMRIVNKETTVEIGGVKIRVIPFNEVGYTSDPDASFMVGHLEVAGAMYEPGGLIEERGVDNTFGPGIGNKDAIYYVGGHYHHPQVVGHSLVVGSCLYHTYKDQIVDCPRGAVLLDLPEPRLPVLQDFKWISNPAARPVHTIRADTHTQAEDEMKRLRDVCDIPVERWHVRTYLPSAEGDKLDGRRVPKGMKVSVVPDDPPDVVNRSDINAHTSPEDAFREYMRQVPPIRLAEAVEAEGLDILRKVRPHGE